MNRLQEYWKSIASVVEAVYDDASATRAVVPVETANMMMVALMRQTVRTTEDIRGADVIQPTQEIPRNTQINWSDSDE